ncbi:MAG: alpha/beta fold hydrolase [Micromonosporaceae bacterium]|nr:alpha/beta fold hydrolase [Micromonosporaceae bacterium]
MTRKGRFPALLLLLLALCLSACDSAPEARAPVTPTGAPGSTVTVELDERPFALHLPTSYDAVHQMPLVVLLHGYTSSAAEAERYFALTAESDRRGFLYAMPDGTRDAADDRFWNATDACCNFYGSEVDDAGYLRRLLEVVTAAYLVDPNRVYVIGHSNGGFMAHRLACEHPSAITAIVSLAGAAPNDPASCTPALPVSVLQIHGTADSTIRFDGRVSGKKSYPSAMATVDLWRRLNGCAEQASTSATSIDLESTLPGAETTVTAYQAGCRGGSRVALWSIPGGGHVPTLGPGFAPAVFDFLLAQVGQR